MTMYFSPDHLSSVVFDERTAHPLRTLPRPNDEAQSRAGALLVTVLIHMGVIFAFILGVQVAAPVLAPPVLMVQVVTPKKDKLDLPTPPPALLKPALLTAPSPEVVVETQASVMPAAPPVTEAPPVAAATSPQRGVGEGRETYLGQLLAQLNRFKHYPPEARKAHIEGVVLLHFVMEADGHIARAEIQKSSCRLALDKEALALMERAQPLPALPADFPTRTLDAVVPIEFALNS